MPKPVHVFGHQNPDADAICSAIAYAEFKNRTDEGSFRAARCGNSNLRIDAILEHFGVPLPAFVGDVTPRLGDVMARDLVTVAPGDTCARALELIERHDIQVVPVVEAGRLSGIASIFHLGRYFLPRRDGPREMRRVDASLDAVADALGAEVLHGVRSEAVEDLYVRVGAMDRRSFDRFMVEDGADPARSVVVVGDRRRIQDRAVELGVRLLVVTGGLAVEPEVLEAAREAGVSVIVSPYDSATTAWAIRTATRVDQVMSTDFVEFAPGESVREVRRKTATLDPAVFMVTSEGGRLEGVFTRRDILRPSETRIILVDHNELSQAVPGAEQVEIVEVVDHHRLGDLRTRNPILFINRPVGSTCTIVADLFRHAGLIPSRALAGVMLGGLISDTLNLRSPTTTRVDREILVWLEGVAGVSADELSGIIFESGSVVRARPAEEVVHLDRKVYEEGEVRFAVSQVEEVGLEAFWERMEELARVLERSRTADGLEFACLLVTDINTQNSLLLIRGSDRIAERLRYPVVEEGKLYRLEGVVSRKKQLIPFLTGLLRG